MKLCICKRKNIYSLGFDVNQYAKWKNCHLFHCTQLECISKSSESTVRCLREIKTLRPLVYMLNSAHPTICLDSYFELKLCSPWYRRSMSIKSTFLRFTFHFFLSFYLLCVYIVTRIWFLLSPLSVQFPVYIWNIVTSCNALRTIINIMIRLLLLLLLLLYNQSYQDMVDVVERLSVCLAFLW
jgi:hypothetical protein